MDDLSATNPIARVSSEGLHSYEVNKLRAIYGFNEIPISVSRSFLKLFVSVISEPMFLMLITASSVFFLLGEQSDAFILLVSVIVVISITFIQERRSENAIEALRELSSPRAEVLRDGKRQRVAGRDLVPGDVVFLSEGDRVPADAELLMCSGLSADESILTGESLSVMKSIDIDPALGMVYSGTMIVSGTGMARITATGLKTEMGKIGKSLYDVKEEPTLLEIEVRAIVRWFAFAGLFTCLLIILLLGSKNGLWLQAFLTGITLSIALLPEEFPVVITLFQAFGAFRLSKENVLTRQARAIRSLGSVTVLCADKTGTITMNRMQLALVADEFDECPVVKSKQLPENYHRIVEYALLASRIDPFDPMEKALIEASRYAVDPSHFHRDWTFVKEYALSNSLLSVSHVWKPATGDFSIVAAKGAPEAIMDLCRWSQIQKDALVEKISAISNKGLRIIGVAAADYADPVLPASQQDFNFQFLGFLGFYDPVRPGVERSIQECQKAGIRVIMITGDHGGTAINIANSIGLNSTRVVTGQELMAMDDFQFKRVIQQVNVFARMVPEQKLRIVEELKEAGEVVGMTGDGVNDSPALKAANIGISMGSRGSDVAREASDIVLLDDDFNTIVKGIRSGRRIFDNMKKALSFVFAAHFPIAGITLAAIIFKWPLVLLPIHVVFLELIIDPTCSIAFEAEGEEGNIMERPPRGLKEKLFSKPMVINSIFQGVVSFIAIVSIYLYSLHKGDAADESRALAFTMMLTMNGVLIFSNRSTSPFNSSMFKLNKWMFIIIGMSIIILGLTLFLPSLSSVFHFSKYHPFDLLYVVLASILALLLMESGKWIFKPGK